MVCRGLWRVGLAKRFQRGVLHTAKILRLSEDLPMVIEIVDNRDKIESFLPLLDSLVKDGLVTLEAIKVLHHRH